MMRSKRSGRIFTHPPSLRAESIEEVKTCFLTLPKKKGFKIPFGWVYYIILWKLSSRSKSGEFSFADTRPFTPSRRCEEGRVLMTSQKSAAQRDWLVENICIAWWLIFIIDFCYLCCYLSSDIFVCCSYQVCVYSFEIMNIKKVFMETRLRLELLLFYTQIRIFLFVFFFFSR